MTLMESKQSPTGKTPAIFYKNPLAFLPEARAKVGSVRVLSGVARNTILKAFAIGGGDRHAKVKEEQVEEKTGESWYEFKLPDEASVVFDGLVKLRTLAQEKMAPGTVLDNLETNMRELAAAVRQARDDVPTLPELGDLAHRMATTIIRFGADDK